MRNSTAKQSGFSLIELVAVVTIVAILAAVAIPGFSGIIQNQRIKSASFELYSSLIVARSEAVKRNDDVTITAIDGSWQNGWRITFNGTVIKSHDALNNVVVTSAVTALVFRRTGRITSAVSPSFQFDVSPVNADYVRCISLELSGLPKTTKGNCA